MRNRERRPVHKLNLLGQRFGRLTVTGQEPHVDSYGARRVKWICRCDCGAQCSSRSPDLKNGKVRSCGCLNREIVVKMRQKHGHAGAADRNVRRDTPTYRSWRAMKERCLNPKAIGYKAYGGRGIKICDRWLLFENFLADMGERPAGKTIDRKDNDGDYELGNCRWATKDEQMRNRRYRPAKESVHSACNAAA